MLRAVCHTHRVSAEYAPPLLEIRRGADRITARRLPDGMYELEHADGAHRYELYTDDAVLVRDVLLSWLDRDSWWCDSVAWSRVDPAIAEMRALQHELGGLLDGLGGGGLAALDTAFGEVDDALGAMDDALSHFDSEITGP